MASAATAPSRLSPAATAAALIALAALYSTARHLWGLPLIAALVLVTHFTRLRLPRQPLAIWTIRFALFSLVIFTSEFSGRGFFRWYVKSEYSNLAGYLCAIELALQYWRRREAPPRGPVLVLSGIIFTMATNTYEPAFIRWLAPMFIAAILICFRDFRARMITPCGPNPFTGHDAAAAWRSRLVRGAYVAAVGGVALTAIAAFQHYGRLLESFTIQPLFAPREVTRSGVSPAPALTATFNATASPVRVMRVDGLSGDAHLRGLSFDTYADNSWGPTFSRRTLEPAGRNLLNSGASGRRYAITRWIDDLSLLYAPLNAAGVAPMARSPAQWDPDSRAVVSSTADAPAYVYEAILPEAEAHQGPLAAPLSEEQRRRCLAVPQQIDPRISALARGLVAGITDTAARARTLERYLQTNHAYSLSVRGAEGDRVSDFILNKRPAHCQYFASALVMMLRCNGIPARYVSGYYAHESAGADAVIVRQRDAHAWTEAWIDGVGWVTLDGTPPDGRPDQAYPPISAIQKSKEWFSDLWARIADTLGGITLFAALTFIAALVAVIITIQWLRLLLRRRRRDRANAAEAYAMPDADLAGLAAAFDQVLARHGVPCPATHTWNEHLAALASSPPRSASDTRSERLPFDLVAARSFIHDYDLVRFGARGDAATIARLRDTLSGIERPPA
jgi:hypothetical protein